MRPPRIEKSKLGRGIKQNSTQAQLPSAAYGSEPHQRRCAPVRLLHLRVSCAFAAQETYNLLFYISTAPAARDLYPFCYLLSNKLFASADSPIRHVLQRRYAPQYRPENPPVMCSSASDDQFHSVLTNTPDLFCFSARSSMLRSCSRFTSDGRRCGVTCFRVD